MTPTEAAATLRALGWRCEPPEALAAPTLAAEIEAPVEPPQAPRVGEAWEAPVEMPYPARLNGERKGPAYLRLRVLDVWEDKVYFDWGFRREEVLLSDWHAWVRRSGARVVA